MNTETKRSTLNSEDQNEQTQKAFKFPQMGAAAISKEEHQEKQRKAQQDMAKKDPMEEMLNERYADISNLAKVWKESGEVDKLIDFLFTKPEKPDKKKTGGILIAGGLSDSLALIGDMIAAGNGVFAPGKKMNRLSDASKRVQDLYEKYEKQKQEYDIGVEKFRLNDFMEVLEQWKKQSKNTQNDKVFKKQSGTKNNTAGLF